MKTIKISEEIWLALQKDAVPFQDTPDDVLKRWVKELSDTRCGLQRTPSTTNMNNAVVLTDERGSIPVVAPDQGQDEETGRQAGRDNRRRYVDALCSDGIKLIGETRISFLTQNKTRVVILVANLFTEEQWFLGVKKEFLTEKPNTFLVLLCIDGDKRLDFVFPPERLSLLTTEVREVHGSTGGLRFSVITSGSRYGLRRVGGGTVDITAYLHNYAELRKAAV